MGEKNISKDIKDNKRLIRLLITAAALAVIYLALVFVLPDMRIFSRTIKSNYSDDSKRVSVKAGDSYERTFNMPFDKVTGLAVFLENDSPNVISINAKAELISADGSVVASKDITSAYDTEMRINIPVVPGTEYTFRFTVDSTGKEDEAFLPKIVLSETGDVPAFSISGRGAGASDKIVFLGVYLVAAAMLLLYVYGFDNKKIGSSGISDKAFIGVLLVFSIFFISQYYDLFMIIKSAFRMIDSFKAGNIRDYYGYSYTSELQYQSNKMLFAYEYNFFQIFFTAILMLPLTFFMNGDYDGASMQGFISAVYLTVVMAILIFVAWKALDKILKACGADEEYSRAVKLLFISSPMLLYMSVLYGQIDIMYMIVIILALPFYYRGQYKRFSLIMSLAVAMKTLPIMIFIPLILLANKKIKDILINCIIVLAAPAFSKIVFEGSQGHRAITAIIEEDYSYVSRIAEVRLGDSFAVFVLAFALICIFCYMHKTDVNDKKNLLYESMLAVFTVYGAFVIFVTWHIQWMIPLVLATAFLLPMVKDRRIMIFDIALEFLYVLTASCLGKSTNMINYGVLFLSGEYCDAPEIGEILNNITSLSYILLRTCLAAVIIYMAYKFICNRKTVEYTEVDRTVAVGRLWILYAFVLFYFWAFFYIG